MTRTLTLGFAAALVGTARQVHGLTVLLCLESVVIICFVSLLLRSDHIFAAILLSIGAVEAAVGIRCLVGLVRGGGTDRVSLAL